MKGLNMGLLSSRSAAAPERAASALTMPFLDAETPKVWRAEWSRLAQVSFELRPKDGAFVIVMTGGGVSEDVAVYKDRALAVDALSRLTAALGSGAADCGGARAGGGWLWRCLRKALKAVLYGALILFVLFLLKVAFSGPAARPGHPPAAAKTGVPQPAEEMFGQ